MAKTNLDVLHLVAEFLEPCPVLYTRLAMVNKDFFRVFTSDKLWAALDAYEKRTNIFPHFLESTRSTRGFIKLYWCFKYDLWDEFVPDYCRESLYIYLGYISNPRYPRETLTASEPMVKLAVCLEPKMLPLFAPECRESYELNLLACQKLAENYSHVPEELTTDKGFYAECLKAHQNDTFMLLGLIELAETRTSRAWALDTLWEINPSKYIEVRSFEGGDGLDQTMENTLPHRRKLWSSIAEKITDKNMALTALKGNGHCLHHFPEYAEDLEIIMAALDRFQWYPWGVPFLENNPNHNLVAKVLDKFPHLLYVAPQGFKEDKQRLVRFLEWAPFIYDVGKLSHQAFPLTVILENITESTWADRDTAGKITDFIYTHVTCSWIPQTKLRPKLPFVLCDDPEWIRERISLAPGAWFLASDRLKGDREIVVYAIESIKSFAKAPHVIKDRNSTLVERLPHCFDSDYKVLELLFSVLNDDDKLEFLSFNVTPTIEIIKALVAPVQDRERAPGGPARGHHYSRFVGVLAKKLRHHARNGEFIDTLKRHKHDLRHLWALPNTAEFAKEYLGPPPSDLFWLSEAELDSGFPSSWRVIARPRMDTYSGKYDGSRPRSKVDVGTAVDLVCKDRTNFRVLAPQFQGNRNVLFVMRYMHSDGDPRHSACRPQCALSWC